MSERADSPLAGESQLGDSGLCSPPGLDSPEPAGDIDEEDSEMPELEDVELLRKKEIIERAATPEDEEWSHLVKEEVETTGEETTREELVREETTREDLETEELIKEELPREESTREELVREETTREDLETEELIKEELPSEESTREELAKEQSIREESTNEAEEEESLSSLSKDQRQAIFLEAKALQEAGDMDGALEKFTAALTGVRPECAFPELPVCLRSLAEIYYKKEEYEKAVHFIQAEKMYYEAALLDTSVLQSILKKDVKRTLMQDNDDINLQKLRADEYETLARFCIEKQELQLALEYAAKAAKLREAIFGPDHATTTQSLDFMTSIYADLGKQEYAESLEKFERSKEDAPPHDPSTPSDPVPEAPNAARGEPQESASYDREVQISLLFFSVMVFIAFGVLTVVSAYAYCELTVSPLCESAVSGLSKQLNWLHYLLHKWLL